MAVLLQIKAHKIKFLTVLLNISFLSIVPCCTSFHLQVLFAVADCREFFCTERAGVWLLPHVDAQVTFKVAELPPHLSTEIATVFNSLTFDLVSCVELLQAYCCLSFHRFNDDTSFG